MKFPDWEGKTWKNIDSFIRKDLAPNVCAVYTEKEYRCKGIAGHLLNMVVDDMRSQGISLLALNPSTLEEVEALREEQVDQLEFDQEILLWMMIIQHQWLQKNTIKTSIRQSPIIRNLEELAFQRFSEIHFVLVDPSEKMLEQAKMKLNNNSLLNDNGAYSIIKRDRI